LEEICKECGQPIEEEDDVFYLESDWWDAYGFVYLSKDYEGVRLHAVCADESSKNTLVYRDANGKIRCLFTDDYYFYMAEEYPEVSLPLVMKRLEKIMKSYNWHKTDAWRGHYKSDEVIAGGFAKIITGWNDAFSSNEYVERVKEVVEMEEFQPIVLVFPISSNLCVTYYDLWAKSDVAEEIWEYILGDEDEAFDWSRGICIQRVKLPKVNAITQCGRPH